MNLSTDNQHRLMWHGMLVLLLSVLLASLALLPVTLVAAEITIENMSASELVRSKDKIPDCRGLQEPAYDIPGSSIGDCVQFFIRKGGEAEDRTILIRRCYCSEKRSASITGYRIQRYTTGAALH